MPKAPTTARVWLDALKPAARQRGLRFVSGASFALDSGYVAVLEVRVSQADGDRERMRIAWTAGIKPLAADDVLWAAFLPDAEISPQTRINRRVNGAFRVRPLRIAEGTRDVAIADAPDWSAVLDDFDRVRAEFIAAHPTVADYIEALEQDRSDRASGQWLVSMLTALIAAGRTADAARMADAALERGERGPMSSTVDVLKYLAAFARGPEAFAAFTESLVPTHELKVLSEAAPDLTLDLARAHHVGRFRHHLTSMDGASPWAVVLSALPRKGDRDNPATLSYLQAAGTAERLAVEYCTPADHPSGAVAVRSVVGRSAAAADGRAAEADGRAAEIHSPRVALAVAPHEVFTAEAAAALFESFYRDGALPGGVMLRPVEGYAADGRSIDLRL